jgi:hypothetical protein
MTLVIALIFGWMHERKKTEEVRSMFKHNAWFVAHRRRPAIVYWDVVIVLQSEAELRHMHSWMDE